MAYGLDSGTVQILIAAKDATAVAFATVNARMKTLEVTAARVRTAVASVAKATALIGTAATIGGVILATKIYGDFEQAIANTASVSSATADELKKLETAAREMGKTTAFSATQAANAMYFLGSAGYDTTQIISSLDGVMLLAGATQTDLAYTSESVVAALNMFNMEASESTRVSNTYAAAIANSQATMDKLTDSMRYIGPVATALGWSFEETTAALGVLFDMGFRGEQAGTILRGAITKTIIPTEDATKTLAKYGLTLEDLNPEIYSLSEQMDILRDANLSVAETMGIFQQRAGPGMLAILNADKDAIRELEEAITDTDAATEMYAIQMNTMKGILTILKSALEEAGIVVGKQLSPRIREAAENFKAAIPTILAYMSTLKNELGPSITNIAAIFTSVKGILKGFFGTDAEDEISMFAALVNKVTNAMKRFFDILDKNPALVKFAIAVTAATIALSYAVPAVMGLYASLNFLNMHPVILTLAAITAALVYLEVEFGLVTNTTAQFGRGLSALREDLQPISEGVKTLHEDLSTLETGFGSISGVIDGVNTALGDLYNLLPDVLKSAASGMRLAAKQAWELQKAMIAFGPLLGPIYNYGEEVKGAGNKSEKAGKQIELTKDKLQVFLTEIEASTPEIQDYKDAVETTATALKTWTTAQLAVQQAQLALSEPKAALTELNKLLTESTGLEQGLAAVLAESQAIWDEANTAKVTTEEKVAEITRKLTDLVKARAQAEEDAAAKIARIAQNEITAKAAIERANVSLLQSQRALITALEDYDDLTRSLAGAELSVEGAEIAVEKARLAYEQIGKGWSPIEIGFSFPGATSMDPFAEQDALLAWRRAELDLATAIDTRADTQERVNALKGAEEIKGVIAAYKGISAEEFESTFYVGGQLDIESLKESITDEDAAIISERIKNLLPDMDLGTGIESTISAITSYEDDILTLEEKLTGYTQDRLDVTEDLHDELESLYEDQIEWEGDLEDAIGARDRATGNLEDAERELGKISKYYADIVKTADNDRLTRAGILYDKITQNETDYNMLLASTGKTYNGLETDVKNLQTVVDTAVTAEKTAQVEYNIELANTKTLLENDMVAAWDKLTQHLETTPANATISLPDIEDLLTPFLVDIQKLADDNPIKIALDWSEGSPFWESGVEGVDYHPPPATEEEPASGWWSAWGYSSEEEAKKGGVKYNPETGEASGTRKPTEDTILEPGAGLEKYTTIPEREPTTPFTSYLEGPKYLEWKAIGRKYDELPTSYSANTELWNKIWSEYEALLNAYNKKYDPDYDKNSPPVTYAHTGGETLKEGLINVEGGEWIFPRDVVAQFKELLTLPSLAPAAQTVTNTISVHIDTINDKSDADYLISELERKFNQRALL